MTSEIQLQDSSATLYAAFDKVRGKLDVNSFRSYLLSLIFLRHLFILSNVSKKLVPAGVEGSDRAQFDIVIPPTAGFDFLFDQRDTPGNGARINHALHQIESANTSRFTDLFAPVHFDRFQSIEGGNYLLRELLELLWDDQNPISESFTIVSLERSADLYEAAIAYFSEFEGKRGGEFSTPPAVCTLLAGILDVGAEETVSDPVCGTGSLLVSICSNTRARYGRAPQKVFGQDINQEACSLARMNLLMHGQYENLILQGDTLQSPKLVHNNELIKFDAVVSHPPFQLRWDATEAVNAAFPERFYRGVPPDSKADFAFISHMLATLKEHTGRMAVIVAHGILFRGNIEGKIREQLITENVIDAIISLPPKLFFNTSIPTAILVFKKAKRCAKEDIIFIDATRDFIKGKNINSFSSEHIHRIVSTLETYSEISGFSRIVSLSEVRNNDYNLSFTRYFDENDSDASPKVSIAELRSDREKLLTEIQSLDQELQFQFKRLGFI